MLAASILIGTCGCARLPENKDRTASFAFDDTESTFLGRLFAGTCPHRSGVIVLKSGLDAFVARAVLIDKAERSVDLQYYMYHQDTIGRLLNQRLIEAADRGVRIRMLIDDMYGIEADDVWTALDTHPFIEVRLFNPFVRNRPKALQFISRFSEVNYRMHSKSFTVDNEATIVGGRNIGDEYFEATPALSFADVDLMAIGDVVPQVSAAFDEYWNDEAAYPATTIAGQAGPEALASLKDELESVRTRDGAKDYIEALEQSNLARSLRARGPEVSCAEARTFYDSPRKKDREAGWKDQRLISQLWPYLEKATEELVIVSPYFVPGKKGAEALCALSGQGIKITILTNSLASNDVAAVHAGYSRYRRQLLEAGIVLYELDERIKKEFYKYFSWLPGLSKSSLHAKALVIDRKAMFVGSMNLDLRSLNINNEIGILVFNEELTRKNINEFLKNLDKAAFRVTLDENGSLRWRIQRDGKEIVYDDEPYAGFWAKLTTWLVGLLPVESLL